LTLSVLEKASDLIDCLGRAGEPVTLGYVRSALGMPKSSTHWLLNELAALGIVRRTEDGRYSLGPRLLYWGEAAADTFDLRAVAEQPMRRLRDQLGESVHLYVREHDTRICIAAVEARHELRPFIQLGRPLPLRVGAAGKLLLAFADREVRDLELRRAMADAPKTPNAPGSRLADQLEQILAERWATSVGEREEGVSAAATAVVDSRDRVVAALCISAPTTRLGRDRFGEMRRPLEQSAAEISALLKAG
jgi:IclR family KDG regulon transcriptional repressor